MVRILILSLYPAYPVYPCKKGSMGAPLVGLKNCMLNYAYRKQSPYAAAIRAVRVRKLRQRKGVGVMAGRPYRKFREIEEDYFRKRPDEIDDYLTEIFDEYAHDGNTSALLASLRVVCRVKGISGIARETGISRHRIQKALSEDCNPRLENINAIMHAMGYRLAPQKLEHSK